MSARSFLRPFAVFFVSLCMAVSCQETLEEPEVKPDPQKPETPTTTYTISVSPNGTLNIPAEGGSTEFTVKTNADVYGYSFPKRDWMSGAIDKDRKVIVITFTANNSGSERRNDITFFGQLQGKDEYAASENVTVVQAAAANSTSTISSAGGKIDYKDISITIPEGTFSADEKVEVTEAPKGSVLGDEEVSAFYDITLRPETNKPLTISIPCDQSGDDLNVVAHIPSRRLSEGDDSFNDIILESSYADGVYTATLPESGNRELDEQDQLTVSVGVARMEYWGQNKGQKISTRASLFDDTFTEGVVSWHFNWGYYDKLKYSETLALHWDDINNVIREAIKTLHNLGLVVTKRNLGIQFKEIYGGKNEPIDGTFSQSAWSDESSTVEYNVFFLSDYESHKEQFRATAIHELMHMFQADYDPRWPIKKAKSSSLDQQLLYESGAVWAEQLMSGSFSNTFVKTYVSDFVRGFRYEDIEELHKNDTSAPTAFHKYTNHGYGASLLMQYITRHMTEYGLKDESILDLYKIWHNTNGWAKDNIAQLTREKGHDVIANYDEFLLALMKGEVENYFDVNSVEAVSGGQINNNKMELTVSGKSYAYGCQANYFTFDVSDDVPLKGKQLVIDQQEDGVCTYVLIPYMEGQKRVFEQYGYKAWKDEPIIIKGADLYEKFYKKEISHTKLTIFTLTVNRYSESPQPYKLSLSLQDSVYAEPTELQFGPEGGTQNVQLKGDYSPFKYYGATVREEGHGWCGVATASGVSIKITVQPNTTGKPRECIVDCYFSEVADADEKQKVKIPVKITQEANEEIKFGYLDFNVGYYADRHDFTEDGKESSYIAARYNSFYLDESHANSGNGTMNISIAGSTVHVESTADAEYTWSGSSSPYHKPSISFDLIDFTGDYSNCKVTNIVFKDDYTYYEGGGGHVEVTVAKIPVQTKNYYYGSNLILKFEANETEGMEISSYQESSTSPYNYLSKFTYYKDSENPARAMLEFSFAPSGKSSSAPRAPLPVSTEAEMR